MGLNQEIFQKDKSCDNQNALEIPEYFKNNDLKAQLQAKYTTIRKLKEHIKSIRENDKEEKVKQEMDEIETINIVLEHRMFKLNLDPLAPRFTSTKVVPLKETTYHSVETHKPKLKVCNKRPKLVKSGGSSKKSKIVDSRIANNSEPNHSWGSNATDVPSSSSLVNDRLSRLFSGIWTLDTQNI
ncbi:hypothetical protein Tco_0340108 [Tanacetum coccineum]